MGYRRKASIIEEVGGFYIVDKTYLNLAKADYQTALRSKGNLATCAPSVTALLSTAIEKCLSQLLVIKGKQFIPMHDCEYLRESVLEVWDDFPERVSRLSCILAKVWYATNRYPQIKQNGYENFNIILEMYEIANILIEYTSEKCRVTKVIPLNNKTRDALVSLDVKSRRYNILDDDSEEKV